MLTLRLRTLGRTSILGGVLVVLAVGIIIGVIVHVTPEAGLPADEHLPFLLIALLASAALGGLGVALILPRPPSGS